MNTIITGADPEEFPGTVQIYSDNQNRFCINLQRFKYS